MATTGPDGISGWKNISRYDINDDKNKKKKQNQLAQNALQKATPAPSATDNTRNKSSGGEKSSAVFSSGKPAVSNKNAGVFDSVKLPYEDTVAQKNAQKAADLKHQQEKYNAEKLAQKQAAQAKAAQEKYAREKYIAQMRQKQRDNQFKGTGMQTNTGKNNMYTATPKMYDTPKANTTPAAQKQWNKGVSGQNSTANSNVLKTNVPKATKAEQDAFINKYLPKLMGTENTPKINYGPNREMAGTVKLNTSKPAVTAPKTAVSTTKPTGPNVEMTKAVKLEGKPQNLRYAIENLKNSKGPSYEISQTRLEGNPQAFYSAVENVQENKGISRETASTNFIAPRGFEIGEDGKIVKSEVTNPKDRSLVQKISDDIFNAKYGMDGLNEVNHTNTYVSKDRYYPMTKEDIYSMSTDEVTVQLGKALKNVRNERADKKQERDILLFRKHLLQAEGYGEEKTAELDSQIKHLDSEITMLNIKNLKANVGYEFCQNYIKMLSEANGDDILKIINEYNHLPYFGNIADAARSAKSGVDKVSDVVSVLENTKVSTEYGRKGVSIFNTNSPKNGFRVIPDYTIDNYGFRDYRLSVTADNIDTLTPDQKNLYKTLDNMPISEEIYDYLGKLPKVLNDFDAEKASAGLTAIGYGLDVFDFLCLVATDYDSSTETVSKDTTRKVTSMITSWIGGLAGGELGGAAGAAIGTAIMPGVGTVVGGAIGAVVGAYVLSELGEDAGMYIGGLDYGPGNPIEYHLERGR